MDPLLTNSTAIDGLNPSLLEIKDSPNNPSNSTSAESNLQPVARLQPGQSRPNPSPNVNFLHSETDTPRNISETVIDKSNFNESKIFSSQNQTESDLTSETVLPGSANPQPEISFALDSESAEQEKINDSATVWKQNSTVVVSVNSSSTSDVNISDQTVLLPDVEFDPSSSKKNRKISVNDRNRNLTQIRLSPPASRHVERKSIDQSKADEDTVEIFVGNNSYFDASSFTSPTMNNNTNFTTNLTTTSPETTPTVGLHLPVEYIIGMSGAGVCFVLVLVIIALCWRRRKAVLLPEHSIYNRPDNAWDNLSLHYIDNPNDTLGAKESWEDLSDDSYYVSLEEAISQQAMGMGFTAKRPITTNRTKNGTRPIGASNGYGKTVETSYSNVPASLPRTAAEANIYVNSGNRPTMNGIRNCNGNIIVPERNDVHVSTAPS